MINKNINRREFVMGGCACIMLAGCASTPRYVIRDAAWPLRVPVGALGERGYVVVEAAGVKEAILVARREGAVSAVELLCTHRACAVYPRRDRVVCPCHGSEFTLQGEVLQGPAEAPLAAYPAREEDGWLIIERRGA